MGKLPDINIKEILPLLIKIGFVVGLIVGGIFVAKGFTLF